MGKRKDDCVDRIGGLPDEILVDIISLLPFKEAVRTCILAKRWVSLWQYVSNLYLDFCLPEAIYFLTSNPKSLKINRSWFVNRINNICNLHKFSTLGEFRVRLDLVDEGFRDFIDKWLEFALSKRVKRLDFNFTHDSCVGKGSYVLSKDTFDRIIGRQGSSSIRLLTSLSLQSVDASGEVLEWILSYCPLLERLSVRLSPGLVKFKVAGPAPFRLKELGVFSCFFLQEFKIDAPSLVHFSFLGRKFRLHMRNAPRLVDALFNVLDNQNPLFAFCNQKGFFNQLHTLHLVIFQDHFNVINFSNPTQFSCLQNLTLQVSVSKDASLLVLTSIINASPTLRKLALWLFWSEVTHAQCSNKIEMPHQSLKTVEIHGYVGNSTSDREFAEYILEHAVVLERIIFDTDSYQHPECMLKHVVALQSIIFDDIDQFRSKARKNAWELKSMASPSLEFIVI